MSYQQPHVRRTAPALLPPAAAPVGIKSAAADGPARPLHSFSRIALTRPAPPAAQFKLSVNTPGDIYEREADATADQVLRMSAPPQSAFVPGEAAGRNAAVQRAPLPGAVPNLLQRCAACDEEAQRTDTGAEAGEDLATADVSGVVSTGLASGGRPLDPDTRRFMEPRFGHDFSKVRIHDNPEASSSASAVSARAYTVGSNIAFRSGEFAPGSGEGRRLLAHELTHVVQQGQAAPHAASVQRSAWVSQMTRPSVQRFSGVPPAAAPAAEDGLAEALMGFGTGTLEAEAAAVPEEAVTGPPGWIVGAGVTAVGGLALGAGYWLSHRHHHKNSANPTASHPPLNGAPNPVDAGKVKADQERAAREKEQARLKKVAECEALYKSYKNDPECDGCSMSDTPAVRAAKIACFTAELAKRRKYLAEKCDYFLEGSIKKPIRTDPVTGHPRINPKTGKPNVGGSVAAEEGHEEQVQNRIGALAKCNRLRTTPAK